MSTLTQAEVDSATNTNQAGTYNTPIEIIADKFIGELIGNATTAKALQKNWRLRLVGDVEGYADLNASDADLNVTVKHSDHAHTADFVGSANYATTTALADLANKIKAKRNEQERVERESLIPISNEIVGSDITDIDFNIDDYL